jgi:hypothetical protein
MKDKEKLEQIWESDKIEWLESIEEKEKIAQVLWKEVERKDIPLSYSSWINSSRSAWCCRDSKFIYGESLKDIIWAILVDYSYYPGWWCGMEYWVKIFVKRWKESDSRRIVYRDAYSAAYDDRWKSYNSIDSIKVEWNKVTLTLSSNSRKDDYTFYLTKNEIEENVLSPEAQEKFKERIESEKERLLKENTRENGIMPSNYDLVYMKMPWSRIYDKKYEKAEIIGEDIDLWKWECYIVIKTQIDANADGWMQFARLKYKITPTSTHLVDRETAYQSELMSGKRIKMRLK